MRHDIAAAIAAIDDSIPEFQHAIRRKLYFAESVTIANAGPVPPVIEDFVSPNDASIGAGVGLFGWVGGMFKKMFRE